MERGQSGGERIGINGAAAVLRCPPDTVRRYVADGRLGAERTAEDGYLFDLSEVEELARELGEDEVFEGEIMGDDPGETGEGSSRLPAVPFERYERLLQEGQDYKTRLEERSRQVEEIRQERDAARVEMDRLWSEIERLNLVDYQRELQEKAISTLEEEKQKLAAERERLTREKTELIEEKSSIAEERTRLEAELKVVKSRGFWGRILGS
jgi:excisionase family DNA binding protein